MSNYTDLFNFNNMNSNASHLNNNFIHKEYMQHYRIYDMMSENIGSIIKDSKQMSNDTSDISLYKYYDELMYENNNGEVIVSGSGKIIGYIFIDPNNIPFNLYIYKKYRGYGFGKLLIQYTIDKYSYNTLAVSMENRVAIDLCSKFGFKVVDICINYKGSKFYIMKRIINPITSH